MKLDNEITFIPEVGPKKAALLNTELSVFSIEDLLNYFPYKYIDRSRIYYIREVSENMPFIQIKGKITSRQKIGEGRQQRLVAQFEDETGSIELVWFKGIKFIEDKYRLNQEYIVFGKPTRFGSKINIAHPEIDNTANANIYKQIGLQAHYNTTEKMKSSYVNSATLRKYIFNALERLSESIPETLPLNIITQYQLLNRDQAIRNIHAPKNNELLHKSRHRLKFEELFYIQLSILRQSKLRDIKYQGYIFSRVGEIFNTFYSNHLPFALTNAQKKVIKEIRADMATGKQMNRLLQGDVGSGKTIVALLTMLIAADNGFQSAIMAPTEILATQHFHAIAELTKSMGINVKLLTGSTKKKERTTIHEELQSGSLQILIGTHALIEDAVQFNNLGLVIIDEQHRFGVAQRAKLWSKNIKPPHILVMTATPIPRTLAMTVYGDLEVSVIDELPPGRKAIQTSHHYDNKRLALYGFLKKQIDLGRQVYVVYPLIKESENLDYKNLEEGYEQLKAYFPQYHISMVHGKLKPAEKETEMQKFVRGETQIMVATTVIEVGVNVPNASVMVIESAERFGLSQLHQLRGRVGRGADQSYCILMSSYQISKDTRKRLEVMVSTTNGFDIAEADLNLRGPGDLDGTIQSGMPFDLKIASLSVDGELLQFVRQVALHVLEEDPLLETEHNIILRKQLEKLNKSRVNWGVIS